jgi:hypothetical protein
MKRTTLIAIAVGSTLAAALPAAYAQQAPAPGGTTGNNPSPNWNTSPNWPTSQSGAPTSQGTPTSPAPGMTGQPMPAQPGPATPPNGFGQQTPAEQTLRKDIRSDEHNLREERSNARTQRMDIRQDEQNINAGERQMHQDIAAADHGANEKGAIQALGNSVYQDREDLTRNKEDLRSDEQQIQADRQDIRKDRRQLSADERGSGDFRNGRYGNDDFRRSGWQESRQGANGNWNANDRWNNGQQAMNAKPGAPVQGMTPATLANNAAADKNKPPTTKPGSQPWYHSFWW